MKNLYTLIVFLMFCLPYFSVAQNCNQPIADYLYQQYRNQVAQPYSDAAKLDRARIILNNNCFTALQIKGLAEVFRDDDARLEFAQLAYPKVFNPQDFYEVYNSFAYFSTVFRLHDFVLARRSGSITNPTNPNNPPQNTGTLNFPNLIYPSLEGYNGPNNCNFPMNDHDFTLMARDVVRLGAENARLNRLNTIGNNYCLSTEQAMKFASLLENEENRLSFLKSSYTRVFDIANYRQTVQLFSLRTYQDQLIAFVNSRTNTGNGSFQQNPLCEVSTSDYNDIKRRLEEVSFDNERINLAKSILRTKRCFTTDQIIGLAALFSFSNQRVDFVKFAYDYTTNVNEYYKTTDAFTFSSDKNEILEFIESKQ